MSDIDTDKVTKRVTIAVLGLAAISFAVPGPAQAQQDPSKIEMKTTDLGHNTYMLEGQGAKITLIVDASAACGLEKQNTTKSLSSRQCVCERRRG